MSNHETFRRRIIERRHALLRPADSPDALAVELDQSRIGRLSRMDAMQQQQMELALGRRHREELRALDHALRRIEDGDYGECLQCGEEIDPRRLEIDPAATHCITCAAARERGGEPY